MFLFILVLGMKIFLNFIDFLKGNNLLRILGIMCWLGWRLGFCLGVLLGNLLGIMDWNRIRGCLGRRKINEDGWNSQILFNLSWSILRTQNLLEIDHQHRDTWNVVGFIVVGFILYLPWFIIHHIHIFICYRSL